MLPVGANVPGACALPLCAARRIPMIALARLTLIFTCPHCTEIVTGELEIQAAVTWTPARPLAASEGSRKLIW
jgi:hypothetical protein